MSVEVLRYAAFTDEGRGGNPAGVVLGGSSLTDAQMLAIAEAIGYSETAFLTEVDGRHIIRFFSPRAEVDFCGHATVATAVAVAEREGPGTLSLTTNAGVVKVRTEAGPDGLFATLVSPPTSVAAAETETLDRALSALGTEVGQLADTFPPRVAYAGNHHLVLGLRNEQDLHALAYDYAALDELMAEQRWTTVHVFAQRDATTYLARNLFPPGGVVEDPATGAAAAAFGGYLRDLGLTTVPGRITVLQGVAMGSPSRLVVDLDRSRHVRVTGTATRLALSPYDTLEQP